MLGVQVRSLVGELRSYMSPGQKKKKKKKKKVATILTKLVNFSTFKTQFKHHYILEGFHGVPETRGSPLCPQNALCHLYCCVQLLQLALSFPRNTLAVSH